MVETEAKAGRQERETVQVMGAELRFLCTGEETGGAWSVMEVAFGEGVGPPPHTHPWGEAYYVTDGEVRFLIGGAERRLRKGDFAYVPAGTPHGFQGASKERARMIFFDSPAHSEAFFREIDREVKELPRDLPKVFAIGDRHQVHFAPPAAAR